MLPLGPFSGRLDPAAGQWLATTLQAAVDGPAGA
jgi:hypothetical protein